MDDHLYEMVKDYGECELVPRFQEEYREYKKISLCPSVEEMRDFIEVLNILGQWAGYNRVLVSDFTPFE